MGFGSLIAITVLSFAVWFSIVYFGGALSGNRAYRGGWYWQSAAMNFWESATCVAFGICLLGLYRTRFPEQGTAARLLSRNAFGVYVFHPPIVIGLARVMVGVGWHPLLKFAALTVAATVVSFGVSETVLRRIPFLKNIL